MLNFPSFEFNERWRKTNLFPNATLQQVIRNLDETGMQIVLVVSSEGTLVGTVTDGDIRRALLSGLDMSSPVDRIMNCNPFVVPRELGQDAVIQLMHANKIHQLPVLDNKRHVVGLHLLDELAVPAQRSNLMVIMAGGQGVRLRPHTENCPKPMLLVAGKPMLEHIIERGKLEGFNHFILAVHYLGHMIEDYFGDGNLWQVKIDYLRENEPLGTAGAINLLSPRPQVPFLVSNGDVLTDIRYSKMLDFHLRHNAVATMAVCFYEWQNPFGVVHTKGVDILSFEEKPISRTHINSGVYVLDPSVLDCLNEGEYCDMPTLFCRLKDKGRRTIVYPMHEPWLDVGCPDDYEQAHNRECTQKKYKKSETLS